MAGEEMPQNPIIPFEERGADVTDLENPRSILNLLTPGVRKIVEQAMTVRAYLFKIGERELFDELKKAKIMPSAVDNRIRLSFWNEYNRAQQDGTGIVSANVYRGICSHQHFTDYYLTRPEKVAWMLCQPASYEVMLEESLQFGLDQLREILELPIKDNKGKINSSLLSLKARITFHLHQLKHGAIVQRSLNVNLGNPNIEDQKIRDALMSGNMEEIQRKLKDLQKRDRLAAPEPANIVEAELVKSPTEEAKPS